MTDKDRIEQLEATVEEHEATIDRPLDLVAKFQRGGVSTLFAEGLMGEVA